MWQSSDEAIEDPGRDRGSVWTDSLLTVDLLNQVRVGDVTLPRGPPFLSKHLSIDLVLTSLCIRSQDQRSTQLQRAWSLERKKYFLKTYKRVVPLDTFKRE